MKLKPIASNMTELTLPSGYTVLFSYETPVACIDHDGRCYRTDKRWSATTSRHVNKWLSAPLRAGASVGILPQSYFDGLAG